MYNSREAWHTSSAMVPGTFNCSCWAGRGYSRMLPSASSMMRAIMLTASIGYFPVAVSAESITASDPSKIALATSEASARVGRGFSVIDSSIWVAVITGRRSSLALEMIVFCTTGTRSGLISTPRSPRATITASAARRIASRFSMACGFSSGADQLLRQQHVLRPPHKTHRDVIRPVLERKPQIRAVFRRQRRNAELQPGKVDALMLAECAAVHNLADHLALAHLLDAQLDEAVRKENTVARMNFPGQAREGCADARGIAENFGGSDGEPLPGAQHHRPATRQRPGADFRSLKVGQNRNRLFVFAGGRANQREVLCVLYVCAVREIQPCHVHPRREQRSEEHTSE